MDDGMDEDHQCACVCSISRYEVHMPILEVVKVHQPNEYLSQWAWMPILKHVWFWDVVHTTKNG